MNRCGPLVSGCLVLLCLPALHVVAQSQGGDGQTTGQPGGGQSPYLSFCQERFYEEEDGLIYCNWAVNFNYACFVSYPSNKVVQAESLISKAEVVGKCDSGEPIIKILHY